ncbi:MAG: hypothetical protein KatS3mg089_0898 [Patescibacteria group bacterium]|nr:MAG: hypothetical protein KatS3mg089_0898 [Patescibacteria group bacterium]
MRKQLLFSLLILLFILTGTFLVVLYGKGYRLNIGEGKPKVSKTGLLVATSIPNGAQVLINGNLTTATDSTIDLTPGMYEIEIKKDGYFPWKKRLEIKEEIVTKADALLYPIAPKLESITTTGVQNPVLDPSGTKIAFTVASQSARSNGVYVYDMNARTVLSLQSAAKLIANDTVAPFSEATLSWTPDGEQIIATINTSSGPVTYLLNSSQFNENPRNVTATLPTLKEQWEIEKAEKDEAQVVGLKSALRKMISDNFHILSWSPDDTKILYIASKSADLPLIIKPRIIGIDTLREVRKIEKGGVYVYDLKEDRNTKILDSVPDTCREDITTCELPLRWFPDSKHLVYVHDSEIHMLEIDGTNDTIIYAGPFIDSFVFPWPTGEKMVILTDLNNRQILPNLYTISLK